MDPSILCLCAVPPMIGAVVVAVMHLRQRSWWRLILWVVIPAVLLIAGVAVSNGQRPAALVCVSGATLLVTVGLIVEVRSPRRRDSADASKPVTE